MNCANCGSCNDDSAKFCMRCGANLEPAAAPVTPAANQPMATPAYTTANEVKKPKKSVRAIAAAVVAIVAVTVFLLPWISINLYGGETYSFNYFDLLDASGVIVGSADNAKSVAVLRTIMMIECVILVIITAVEGFKGNTSDWGIATGIIDTAEALIFAISHASEGHFAYLGVGAYLFLALSITLLVLSCKKVK